MAKRISKIFRPKYEHFKQVEMLSGFGFSHDDIASLIINEITGVPITTAILERNFKDQLREGPAKVNGNVVRSLYQKAIGNGPQSVTAAIFWCKTRCRWRETDRLEIAGKFGPMEAEHQTMVFAWEDDESTKAIEEKVKEAKRKPKQITQEPK